MVTSGGGSVYQLKERDKNLLELPLVVEVWVVVAVSRSHGDSATTKDLMEESFLFFKFWVADGVFGRVI